VIFIAVDKPQGDGSADLSSVVALERSMGRTLAQISPLRVRPLFIVNKCTVPMGGGDYVSMLIREGIDEEAGGKGEHEAAEAFVVASNPEFLR
jgi:UDPglucose 6-dehydrogenase